MRPEIIYTLVSVLLVSAISLVGVFTLSIKTEKLKKILIYFLSFSAGAMLGDAFIHLLPEAVEEFGMTSKIGLSIFYILVDTVLLVCSSIVTGKQIGRASCRERVYVLV